jgi:hypothetical protein
MAYRKQETEFTVTDRRPFTAEGDLRSELPPETEAETAKPAAVPVPAPEKAAAASTPSAAPSPAPESSSEAAGEASAMDESVDERSATPDLADMPAPPTVAEEKAQNDAYRESVGHIDSQVELSGRSAKEFEMTFERFMASLYMTAMLQMGLMHQQGEQPRIDIIGARQTIDTISLLAEKTKGNLTTVEENFLRNSLYELRMAYVEVTNALARPPQPAGAGAGPGKGPGGIIGGR